MSFGKVKEAVSALKRDGKLPPHLRRGELHKRIWDRLVELGYDPKSELPSRRSLDRYLERLLVGDATCANCATCASRDDTIIGITDPELADRANPEEN